MKLLYRTAEWHGLAKLRMHTEPTLALLEELTQELGELLRKFRRFTSNKYSTYELPREAESRRRRELDKTKPTGAVQTTVAAAQNTDDGDDLSPPDLTPRASFATGQPGVAIPNEEGEQVPEGQPARGAAQHPTQPAVASPDKEGEQVPEGQPARGAAQHSGRKPRKLNLNTVKLHFLGDYVRHIHLFGTTDSYSTQIVSSFFPSFLYIKTHCSIGRAGASFAQGILLPDKQEECCEADGASVLEA